MEHDYVKRTQWAIIIVFILSCVVFLIILAVSGAETEVMRDRFRNADDIFNGIMPELEYPPLVLVFILIPRIFASTPYWYAVGFAIEMLVFLIIGLLIVRKLAELLGKDQKKFMLAYTILMMLMFEFVVDRYDIIPAVLVLLAVYCYMTKRYAWAFILLSFGMMIKLYPAILFPIFLIPFIMDRNWKEALKGTAAFVIASLAVVVPVMVFQPDMLSYFIGYHADRPLQIESLLAPFIYLFAMFGFTDVAIEYGSGSDNLVGPWPDAAASLLTPLMILSIVLIYVLYAYKLKKMRDTEQDDENSRLYLFASAILLSVMMFIMVGKVFSSQYFIWMIPPLVFVFMTAPYTKEERNIFILLAVTMAVTIGQFAYNVGYLGGAEFINDLGMMMILARNIMMIALLYLILKSIYRRIWINGSGSLEPQTTDS